MKSSPLFQAPTKEQREFAALSYLWCFSILVYFSPHGKSSFVKHHAKQGVFLFLLSILFYFLPGYFAYLNVLVVFLMVLGIVEAALGHWYYLPLLGSWMQGNFDPEKHFSLLIHWGGKIKKAAKTEQKMPVEEQIIQRDLAEKFYKQTERKNWKQLIKKREKSLQEFCKDYDAHVKKIPYGLEVLTTQGAKVVFGGVQDMQWIIAYPTGSIALSGDISEAGWEIRKFHESSIDEESLEALLKLLCS